MNDWKRLRSELSFSTSNSAATSRRITLNVRLNHEKRLTQFDHPENWFSSMMHASTAVASGASSAALLPGPSAPRHAANCCCSCSNQSSTASARSTVGLSSSNDWRSTFARIGGMCVAQPTTVLRCSSYAASAGIDAIATAFAERRAG
jgi:hypothetical protein